MPPTVQAIEQMLALAKKVEASESERDLVLATKAEIGNHREATAEHRQPINERLIWTSQRTTPRSCA